MNKTRVTYRLTIGYDGRGFSGFARQPELRTVESTIVAALRPLIDGLPSVQVGGRTDRGVHAVGQVVSFWTWSPVPVAALRAALDGAAPGELWVVDACRVPRWFHARYSAVGRQYTYLAAQAGVDASTVDDLLQDLVGTHDFFAFARMTPKNKSTVRRLDVARARRVRVADETRIRFDFAGAGFLRRQVRVMVATALREAASAQPTRLADFLESRDRRATAEPAAPDGLYLTGVGYDGGGRSAVSTAC